MKASVDISHHYSFPNSKKMTAYNTVKLVSGGCKTIEKIQKQI